MTKEIKGGLAEMFRKMLPTARLQISYQKVEYAWVTLLRIRKYTAMKFL